MIASDDAYEGYGHGGPGICLGDGQTEAEKVLSQCGRAAPAYVPIPDLPWDVLPVRGVYAFIVAATATPVWPPNKVRPQKCEIF